MHCFTMCYIIIYYTAIMLNALDEMYHNVEFWIIESWSK